MLGATTSQCLTAGGVVCVGGGYSMVLLAKALVNSRLCHMQLPTGAVLNIVYVMYMCMCMCRRSCRRGLCSTSWCPTTAWCRQ